MTENKHNVKIKKVVKNITVILDSWMIRHIQAILHFLVVS